VELANAMEKLINSPSESGWVNKRQLKKFNQKDEHIEF
jgi:hypothetical protein